LESVIDIKDDFGYTCLHAAARVLDVFIVQRIIELNPQLVNESTKRGLMANWLPIHCVADMNKFKGDQAEVVLVVVVVAVVVVVVVVVVVIVVLVVVVVAAAASLL
jgi:hypothetical protein